MELPLRVLGSSWDLAAQSQSFPWLNCGSDHKGTCDRETSALFPHPRSPGLNEERERERRGIWWTLGIYLGNREADPCSPGEGPGRPYRLPRPLSEALETLRHRLGFPAIHCNVHVPVSFFHPGPREGNTSATQLAPAHLLGSPFSLRESQLIVTENLRKMARSFASP